MSNLKTAKSLLVAGAAALAFASPAVGQSLDTAMNVAKSSTASSAASQQTVERLDDEADNMSREYSALLQQVDNLELYVARQDLYLESQRSEIASLQEQLETVEATKQGMVPMMLRMAIDLEDSIKGDYPFDLERRQQRVADVMNDLADPALTPVDQYRKLLRAYQIEVSLGQGIGTYEGPHPEDASRTVDYIRFGRLAYVYMTKDEKEVARYDLESDAWVPVEKNMANNMRDAIRIARGQGRDILQVPAKLSE